MMVVDVITFMRQLFRSMSFKDLRRTIITVLTT